jgi:hypothetical protein
MRDGHIAVAVLVIAAAVAFARWWQRNVVIVFEPIETEEGDPE